MENKYKNTNINLLKNFTWPPRLHYGLKSFIIAKDTKNKKILLGGLGAMGIGIMWFNIDGDEKKEGFNEAPERDSTIYYD